MEPSLNSSSLGLVQIDGLSDAGFSMNDFTARSLASLSSVVLFEEDQLPDEQQEPAAELADDPPAAIPSFLLRPDAVSPETIRSLCLSDHSPVQSDDAPSPAGQSDEASKPAGQSRPSPARTDQSHLATNRFNDVSRDVARPGGQSQFGLYSAEVSRPSFVPILSEYDQRDAVSYTALDMQYSVVDFSGYQISARSTSIGAPSHVSRANLLEPAEVHVSRVNPFEKAESHASRFSPFEAAESHSLRVNPFETTESHVARVNPFETTESHISQANPFEFAVPSAPCAPRLEVGGGNFQKLQSEFDAGMFAKSEDAFEAELKADEALLQKDVEDATDGVHSFCEKSGSTSFQRLSDNDLSLMKIRYFEGFSQPLGALGDVSGVERPPFGLSHVSVAPDDSDSGSTLHGSVHSVAVTSPQRSPDVNTSRTSQDPSRTFTLDSPGCPDHQSVAGSSLMTGAAGTRRSAPADPGRQGDSCRTLSVTTAGFSAGLVQLSPSGRLLAPGEAAAASSVRSTCEPSTEKVPTSAAAPQPVTACTYSPPERGSADMEHRTKMLRGMAATPAVGVEAPLTSTGKDAINCSAVNAVLSTIRQQLALEELSMSESVNVTQMLADMQEEETRKLQLKLSASDRNGSRTSLKSVGPASDNDALPKQQLGSDVVCATTGVGGCASTSADGRAATVVDGRANTGAGGCAGTAAGGRAATAAGGRAATAAGGRAATAAGGRAVTSAGGRATTAAGGRAATAAGGRAATAAGGRAATAANIRANTAVDGLAAPASKQNVRPDPAPQQQPAKPERGRSATRHHACFSSAGRSEHTARHLSKPRSVSRDVKPCKTGLAAVPASHRPRLKPVASLPLTKPSASSSAVASGAALRRVVPRMGARGGAAVETAVPKALTEESGSYVSPEFLVSQVSRRYPSSTPKLAVSTAAVSLSADDSLHQISPIVGGGDENPTHAAAGSAAKSIATDDEAPVTPAETALQQPQTDGPRQRPRRSRIPTPVWRKHAAESNTSSAVADEAARKQLTQRLIQTRESISAVQSLVDSKVSAYKRAQRSSSVVRHQTSAPIRSGSSMSNSETSDQLPTAAVVAASQELRMKVPTVDDRPIVAQVEENGLPAGNCTIVLSSDSSSSSASSDRSAPGGGQLVQDASLTCDSSSTSSSLDSSAVTVTRSPRKAAASLASECGVQSADSSARFSSDGKECILLDAPREITLDEVICLGTEVVLPVQLTNISTGSVEVIASISEVDLDSVRLPDIDTALQAVSPSRSIIHSSQSATVKLRVVPIVAGCLSLSVALSASEVAPGSPAQRHDLTITVNCTVETPNLIFMSEEDNWLNFGSVPEECYKLLPLSLVNLGRCTVPVDISVTSPGDVFHLPDDCSVTGTQTQPQCQSCPGRLAPTRARFALPPSHPHRPHVASVTWHVALRTPRLPTREGDRALPLLESLQGTLDVSLSRAATADQDSNPHPTLLTCRLTATLGRVHLRMRCREPLELSCRPAHTTSAKLPMRNAGSVVLELSVSVRGPLRDHLLLHSPVLTIPPGSDRDLVVTYQPPRHPQQLPPSAAATSSQLVMQVLPGGQLFEFAVTGVTTEVSPGNTAARSSAAVAHQTRPARAGSDVCMSAAAHVPVTVPDCLQPATVSCQRAAAPHRQQFTATSVPDHASSGEPPVPVQNPEDLHIAMPPPATRPAFSVVASDPGRRPLSQVQPPQAATSVGCDMSEVQLRSSRSQLVWLGVPCELASRRSLLLRNSSQADLRLRLTIRDSTLFTFDAPSSGSSGCFLDLVIPGRGDREVSVLFRPTEVTAARGLLVIKPRGQVVSHAAVTAAAKLIKFSIPLIGYSGSCRVVCGPDSSVDRTVDLGDVQADSTAQTSVHLSNTGNRPAFICSALFWDEECLRAVPAHQCIVSAERLVLPPGQSAQLQVALRVPATRDGGAISGGGANSTSSARSLLACLQLNTGDELMRQTYKRLSADKCIDGGSGDSTQSSSNPRLLRDLRAQFVGEVADDTDHVRCLAGLKHLPDTLVLAVRQLKIPITASSSSAHGAELLTLLPAEETCLSVLDFTAAAPSMVPSPAAQRQPPPSPPVRDH